MVLAAPRVVEPSHTLWIISDESIRDGSTQHMKVRIMNFAFSRPSSKITRMSSPGFQWPVRGLVRAALLDDSGQTDACCASLVTPTRGPERLEG